MKLISYQEHNTDRVAILFDNKAYTLSSLDSTMPGNMMDLLNMEGGMERAKQFNEAIAGGAHSDLAQDATKLSILAPVPKPTSCRDAYAFRQHVATARRNRGVDMIPEFDQYPIFYFTNHNAVGGPGDVELMPDHMHKLDFELEAAIVIGKKGRNVSAKEADSYIAGYCIMNDLSARVLQMEEMKLNLGPAKGKDFSTTIGPYLVTPDELEPYKTDTKEGHIGDQYNLSMKAWVNGTQVSEGNMAQMDWTFAEIVERCAYGADVFPGDVIGSGTVGTGCFLELNGTGLLNDPNYPVQWLKDGDEVRLEIDGLGSLSNTMKVTNSEHSILALKKNV